MKPIYHISVMNKQETLKDFYTTDMKMATTIIKVFKAKYVPTVKSAIGDYYITAETLNEETIESIDYARSYGYEMIVTLNGEMEPIAFQIMDIFPWEYNVPIVEMVNDVKHRITSIYYVKLFVVAKNADTAIESAKKLIKKELTRIKDW